MRNPDMKDAELAALAQAGDREAFGVLVERHAGQARRVARAVLGDRDEADDAAQDGFLAALRHLGRYDPERPFGPWLMRIVTNAAYDRRRRRKVRTAEPLSERLGAREAPPDIVTDRGGLQNAVVAALETLPERQRVAIVLFDVEGYAHREIAQILGIPEGTARSDVFHARRALRNELGAWKDWTEETG
jgi:RNA polymerase sigma-70 factor (ECF subfamily)